MMSTASRRSPVWEGTVGSEEFSRIHQVHVKQAGTSYPGLICYLLILD